MTSRRASLEEKLHEAEQRLRLVYAAAGMGGWDWELRTNRFRWSPELRQIIGVQDFEGTWDAFSRLVHPEDLPLVRAALVRAIETHTTYACEFRLQLPDGSVRWLADSGRVVYDSRQRPVRLFGTAQDVTERYTTEEKLRARDERLQLAFQATGIGVWEWTVATNAIYWSPESFAIIGLHDYSATLDDFLAVVHPEDRARVMTAAEMALAEHSEYRAEFRIVRPDGTERWVSNVGRAIYDPEHRPLRLLGIIRDITDEHTARQTLREQEDRLKLALAETQTGVFERDLVTDKVTWSPEGYDIFGVDTFEGTAQAFRQFLHPDDLAWVQAVIADAVQHRKPIDIVCRTRRPNGEIRWVKTLGKTLYADDGRPLRIVGTLRDVTSEHRAPAPHQNAPESGEPLRR